MKVAVIGYGLIGRERVRALVRLRDEDKLVSDFAVCDPFAPDEQPKVEALGGTWCASLDAVRAFSPDFVVIATSHDAAVDLCSQVLAWGVRVLMEKPFGRSLAEAEKLAAMVGDSERLFIGFNYRFFPGIAALLADAKAGLFGEIVSVNMKIGHGGSPGMEKTWKLDPIKAGGGCLLDPGVHMLDLCQCILPDASVVHASTWNGFWKTGIDEEAHVLLRSGSTIFNIQFSVVRWRSTFLVEVNGTEGYGVVSGRGRSYGPMKYIRGRRWGWQSAANQEASEELVNVSDCDDSFRDEMRALFSGQRGTCTAAQALAVMRVFGDCKTHL